MDRDRPSLPMLQTIKDRLAADVTPSANTASFMNVSMDDAVWELAMLGLKLNLVDRPVYKEVIAMEEECVSTIATFWNLPGQSVGTSTAGSSEACLLAALAMRAANPSNQPNIVLPTTCHECWRRFCSWMHVTPRFWRGSVVTPPCAESLATLVDEHTIGVVLIAGDHYTGAVADVAATSRWLKANHPSVPIHVDAASGGFVLPFTAPDVEWDFRCSQVASISTSGHKFGESVSGTGWVVWRERRWVEPIETKIEYLGAPCSSLGVNFSRPSSGVLVQYYQLQRLGREGFTQRALGRAGRAAKLHATPLRGLVPLPWSHQMPVVAWHASTNAREIQSKMRALGWYLGVYPALLWTSVTDTAPLYNDLDTQTMLVRVVVKFETDEQFERFRGDLIACCT